MHTVYVHYIGQEVRYFSPRYFYFAVTYEKGFHLDFGESAISNILALGWRTILRNPGLPYDWLKLSPRQATVDNPDPIMQNTTLCCLELYAAFTLGFKMKRRVRGI